MRLKEILSLKRFTKSLNYALQGIQYLIKNENNFGIHLIATILVIPVGFYCQLQTWEWCIITIAIGMVTTAEALNTSIELLTDLITQEKHPLAKKAKDTAAGAVLLSTLTAITVGSLILLPKLLHKIQALFS